MEWWGSDPPTRLRITGLNPITNAGGMGQIRIRGEINVPTSSTVRKGSRKKTIPKKYEMLRRKALKIKDKGQDYHRYNGLSSTRE